jgi:hypothetical protein
MGILQRLVSAVKNSDPGILASIQEYGEQTVLVRKEDLNAARIYQKAVNLRNLSPQMQKNSQPPISLKNPYREAVKIYKENAAGLSSRDPASGEPVRKINRGTTQTGNAENSSTTKKENPAKDPGVKLYVDSSGNIYFDSPKGRIAPVNDRTTVRSSKPSGSVHFRDWNPDSEVAIRAGVSLKYSSTSNEIMCPELNLRSRSVRSSRNLSTITGIRASGGVSRSSYRDSSSSRSYSSSSSSSSRSSGSSRTTSVRSMASSGAGSSSSGSSSSSSKSEKKEKK